jgi:hypothetical protein
MTSRVADADRACCRRRPRLLSSRPAFLYAAAPEPDRECISVPHTSPDKLLDRLDELKRPGGAHERARLRSALARVARREFDDARSLIRFHEILLFLRAYPQSRELRRQAEKLLSSFKRRVERLRDAPDFYEFAEPQVSGIAGTSFSAVFGYHISRWLAARHPARTGIEWEGYEDRGQLAAVLPRFIPLLEEEAYVENFFTHREELMRAARGREPSELIWLLRGFARLRLPEEDVVTLYESLRLAVSWKPGDSSTRTLMRRRVSEFFYHDAPLLARRDVSLAHELRADAPPLPVEKLSRAEGQKLLDLGRETMAVRYRELHGFTHGDPRTVLRADAGRGVEIFFWGVPARRRLPTLAYRAQSIFKNGVPCGYAEALTIFERVEAGLNLFYTFREGESAWIYARILRLFRQLLGARVFSIDPYQLGHGNEEGIESGAFWFYRKLGFRPVVPHLAGLTAREEQRIAARTGYRTTARTLRELASGHVLYEAPDQPHAIWDDFHVRNLVASVARRMSRDFGGDSERIRRASVSQVSDALDLDAARWNEDERRALENFSLLLALIPDLPRWTVDEKRALVRIVRAKAGADELSYLRLLHKHERLRREFIKLGGRRREVRAGADGRGRRQREK